MKNDGKKENRGVIHFLLFYYGYDGSGPEGLNINPAAYKKQATSSKHIGSWNRLTATTIVMTWILGVCETNAGLLIASVPVGEKQLLAGKQPPGVDCR